MKIENSTEISSELKDKYNKLKELFIEMEEVIIAFSGGVDSSFLLKVALDTLSKEKVLAITADSEIRFSNKIEKAKKVAEDIGTKPLVIETSEISKDSFRKNDEYRCYYCKYELYQRLQEIAKKKGINWVVDGTNADDLVNEDRPGMKAIEELNIRTPLKKAGLKKEEIRRLSKVLGLETWNQASDTCLATRFSYDLEIQEDKLAKLEKIENYLRQFDFEQLRARVHDENTLRIEVLASEMDKIMKRKAEIVSELKKHGFSYITLDLEGYRSGSTKEAVK
ncbi:MAG: ATP-dependent sacrificial sulfur transferase LarE [Bacillota bacterium]